LGEGKIKKRGLRTECAPKKKGRRTKRNYGGQRPPFFLSGV